MFSYLYWDPNPALFDFSLPLLNRPILWYGFFFALGFFLGYGVLLYLLRSEWTHLSLHERKKRSRAFAEKITFYVLIGAVVGARLGDLLFYQDWEEILRHPASIIAVWQGGLASHGGALGILIALGLLSKKEKISFWKLLDFVVIPTALAAVCIRIGNFFNQEILGTPSDLPWAVLFAHPADRSPAVPRHPAQLYEALWYLCVFLFLFFYWRTYPKRGEGKITGLFLILVFTFRFFVEFIKVEQSVYFSNSAVLTMGQWLSIPFVLLGVWLLCRTKSNA